MVNEISKLLERGVEIKTLDKRLDTTSMPEEIVRLIVGVMGYAAEMEAVKKALPTQIEGATDEQKVEIRSMIKQLTNQYAGSGMNITDNPIYLRI